MLNIIIFCFGIMYTPGPVNLLSLNRGLRKRPGDLAPFALGVACALCAYFLLTGYAGGAVVNERVLPYLAVPGCLFIVYLAARVLTSPVAALAPTTPGEPKAPDFSPTFKDGLFMQLLNPKSFIVVLPVATVQFPAAGITGPGIALWSVLLALLGFGAPMSYAAAGALIGRRVESPRVFRLFNAFMGLLLLYAAGDIAYQNVYVPLIG